MEFLNQTPPEMLGAVAIALLLLVWALMGLSRRSKRKRQLQQSADEFAQRRAKPPEVPGTPVGSPAGATKATIGQAQTQVVPEPTSTASSAAPAPSESRWMQSRIPVADTRELSDSELQAWSPTEVMPKREER